MRDIILGWWMWAMGDNEDLYEERIKICKGCDFYKFGFCASCGCYLQAKTRCEICECPEDKWK